VPGGVAMSADNRVEPYSTVRVTNVMISITLRVSSTKLNHTRYGRDSAGRLRRGWYLPSHAHGQQGTLCRICTTQEDYERFLTTVAVWHHTSGTTW
jgi:hypothetical protein